MNIWTVNFECAVKYITIIYTDKYVSKCIINALKMLNI